MGFSIFWVKHLVRQKMESGLITLRLPGGGAGIFLRRDALDDSFFVNHFGKGRRSDENGKNLKYSDFCLKMNKVHIDVACAQ